MATIQEHIIRVLQESSPVPLKALDIARKINDPQYTKKNVNQVIRQMRELKLTNPRQNPPLWTLHPDYRGASGGVGSTSSGTSQPASSSSQSVGATSQPLVGGSSSSQPPSASSMSVGERLGPVAQYKDKDLFTKTVSKDGAETFSPLRRNELLQTTSASPLQSSATQNDSLQSGSSHLPPSSATIRPIQETASNSDGGLAQVLGAAKVDSINKERQIQISDDCSLHKEMNSGKESLVKDKSELKDVPSYQQSVFESSEVSVSVGNSTIKQLSAVSLDDNSNSSSPKVNQTKGKKKRLIAANFSNNVTTPAENINSESVSRESVLQVLEANRGKAPLSTYDIKEKLGLKMRATVLYVLKELLSEGKVEEMKDDTGGISLWSLSTGI